MQKSIKRDAVHFHAVMNELVLTRRKRFQTTYNFIQQNVPLWSFLRPKQWSLPTRRDFCGKIVQPIRMLLVYMIAKLNARSSNDPKFKNIWKILWISRVQLFTIQKDTNVTKWKIDWVCISFIRRSVHDTLRSLNLCPDLSDPSIGVYYYMQWRLRWYK